jgi:hypothetical protein
VIYRKRQVNETDSNNNTLHKASFYQLAFMLFRLVWTTQFYQNTIRCQLDFTRLVLDADQTTIRVDQEYDQKQLLSTIKIIKNE